MESINMTEANEDVLRVFMFESWVRFYYAVEESGEVYIRIPEETLIGLKVQFPRLSELAENLNNEVITPELSQQNVCTFVSLRYDGTKYAQGVIPNVLDSKQFKIEMYVFNLWISGHEQLLDEEPAGFQQWLDMYSEWKKMEEVQEYLEKLTKANTPTQGSNCVH